MTNSKSLNEKQAIPDLDARLAALKQPHPDPDHLYHAITLTADDNLKVVFGTHSGWAGWYDNEKRYELRESRLVYSDYVKIWQTFGLPYSIILTVDDLTLFLLGGGHALVEKDLAEGVFENLLGPHPVVNVGPLGFQGLASFGEEAFQRAPTPKTRMKILKRDNRKCRVCGRRPEDNSDLELHIHHIRPWAKGGVTDPSNLITLCHTCHNGLMPHEDPLLFQYLLDEPDGPVEAMTHAFLGGVANYRRVGFFGGSDEPSPKRRKRPSPNKEGRR